MSNIELIEESPMSLVEVKERLAEIKKRDKELDARALKVEEYVHKFANEKKTKDLVDKLKKLDVSRLKDRNIKKIVDIMPNGHPFDTRPGHLKTPIAQALGKEHFVLLELVPKKGIFLQPLEEVYIGEGKRDKIHHIYGKIEFNSLTETAKNELNYVIGDLVKKDEAKFVED